MWIQFSELDADARNALPDSDFAWIDKDGQRHLPLHDANHVRTALSRIDEVKGLSGATKQRVLAKIKAKAGKFGIDTSSKAIEQLRKAADGPHFGPGGDLDWDDKEEPDESEDDTRPAAEKMQVGDGDGDDDDDDDEVRADEGAPSPPPGLTTDDVHVPGPLNAEKKKKSKTLAYLARSVRAHFASGRQMNADQWERFVKQAQGRQGGLSKKPKASEDQDGCHGICCAECAGAGCGCCAACEAPDEPRAYTEGSPHFVAKDGTGLRMFIPLQFTEGGSIQNGEWIEFLPAPGTWDSPRYGEICVTRERNENFVRNFNAGAYQDQIPIDAEHETKLSGALGWVGKGGMRVNPNGSVGAHVELTPRGQKMLAEKAFKYFSPEWYDLWKDPATGKQIADIAIGGAFTTKPFFKPSYLKPVIAGEQGVTDAEETTATKKETRTMAGEENEGQAKRLTEMEQQIAALTAERDSAKQFAEAQKTAVEAAQEVAKQAADRVAKIESDNRHRAFTEVATEFIGDTAKHVALMEKLSTDEEAYNQYVETQKSAAEVIKAAGFWNAIGSGTAQATGDTSAVEIARKGAEAVVAAGGEKSQARAAADAWTPELYEQYLRENGDHVHGRSRN